VSNLLAHGRGARATDRIGRSHDARRGRRARSPISWEPPAATGRREIVVTGRDMSEWPNNSMSPIVAISHLQHRDSDSQFIRVWVLSHLSS